MGRLTADVVLSAPQRISPTLDRELYLRGLKIPEIENLAVVQDGYDAIDLCDNEIARLEGFPLMRRMRTLLIANNRISRVSPTVGTSLPLLETLVMASNRLSTLGDIAQLASLKNLTLLSLVGNNVTRQPYYRLFTVHMFKKLRLLDFTRIRKREKLEAAKLFSSKKGKALLAEVLASTTTTMTTTTTTVVAEQGVGGRGGGVSGGIGAGAGTVVGATVTTGGIRGSGDSGGRGGGGGGEDEALTPQQGIMLQQLLASAKTNEDLEVIETAMKEGRIVEFLQSKQMSAGSDTMEGDDTKTTSG